MKNFVSKLFKWQWFLCLAIAPCLLSCKEEETTETPPYDSSKPVVLTTFYPTTGHIATQVILQGDNFGNNKDAVRVWFNEKRAPVISVKGDKMLVLAPKLPGDECTISVVAGSDSTWYRDKIFNYITQTTISTLAGGDSNVTDMPTGTVQLSTAQFKSKPENVLTVDAEDNLFVNFVLPSDNGAHNRFYLANEEADKLRVIGKDDHFFVGGFLSAYDPIRGNVYYRTWMGTENGYSFFDSSSEYTAISVGNIAWDKALVENDGSMDLWGSYRVMAMRPSDGMFYLRGNRGEIGRFDPETAIGENLSPEEPVPFRGGDCYGMVFDPRNDNILYFSVNDRHCIYKYDLTTGECVQFAGIQGSAGHVDGEAGIAKFNQPCQLCIDSQNNMYVADRMNHCIRKISLETGYVSTVAGIPQQSGYINGTAKVAKFNQPIGLAITSEDVLYIGDSENYAIRRLAIE